MVEISVGLAVPNSRTSRHKQFVWHGQTYIELKFSWILRIKQKIIDTAGVRDWIGS
jgi:hypothetical protein